MTDAASLAPRAQPARRVLAATRLFRTGQSVRFKTAMLSAGGVYLIVASLPPLGGSPQYRIRSESEKFERMASEVDIELASAKPGEAAASVFETQRAG